MRASLSSLSVPFPELPCWKILGREGGWERLRPSGGSGSEDSVEFGGEEEEGEDLGVQRMVLGARAVDTVRHVFWGTVEEEEDDARTFLGDDNTGEGGLGVREVTSELLGCSSLEGALEGGLSSTGSATEATVDADSEGLAGEEEGGRTSGVLEESEAGGETSEGGRTEEALWMEGGGPGWGSEEEAGGSGGGGVADFLCLDLGEG